MSDPTDSDVRGLVDSIPESQSTASFIATAVLLVNEELGDSGLSSSRLDQIKLYLAAHFATITVERGGLRTSKAGEASDAYQPPSSGIKVGGIGSTRYGQQAISLDTTGKLAALGSGAKRAIFKVVPGGTGNWDPISGSFIS